jgi:hypothetical protein
MYEKRLGMGVGVAVPDGAWRLVRAVSGRCGGVVVGRTGG